MSHRRVLQRHLSTLAGGLVAVLLALPAPGVAQDVKQVDFNVYLLGLRAGTMSYAIRETDQRYSVSAKARSAGLLGFVSDFAYDASTIGRKGPNGYVPERFTETSNEDAERYDREIRYDARGTPQLVSDEPPEPFWVSPSAQRGTLDPLTSVYELLRDRTGETPCTLDVTFGDGARTGTAVSRPGEVTDEGVTCTGVYTRGGGFSPEQMAEATTFPFTLTYRQAGPLWELTRVTVQSLRGRAVIIRR